MTTHWDHVQENGPGPVSSSCPLRLSDQQERLLQLSLATSLIPRSHSGKSRRSKALSSAGYSLTCNYPKDEKSAAGYSLTCSHVLHQNKTKGANDQRGNKVHQRTTTQKQQSKRLFPAPHKNSYSMRIAEVSLPQSSPSRSASESCRL